MHGVASALGMRRATIKATIPIRNMVHANQCSLSNCGANGSNAIHIILAIVAARIAPEFRIIPNRRPSTPRHFKTDDHAAHIVRTKATPYNNATLPSAHVVASTNDHQF